jgi:hypothetical protein
MVNGFISHFKKGWRGDSWRHSQAARGIETGSKRRTPSYETDYRIASFIHNAPAEEPEAAVIPGISAPLEEQQAQPVEGRLLTEPVSTVSLGAPIETLGTEFKIDSLMIPGTPPEPKTLEEEAPGIPEG